MSYSVTQESFDSLASCGVEPNRLSWDCFFVLPVWVKVWWQNFGGEEELYLVAVRQADKITGIAPLMIKDGTASFLGSTDVSDCLDFVITPGLERDFFTVLLDDLKQKGVSNLDLKSLRPDSTVLNHLVNIARERGYEVFSQPEDFSLEVVLPSTWEEYLAILTTKQRHEVRRKLRRLLEAGKIDYRIIEDREAVNKAMDTFLKMFSESRSDKAAFLTGQREVFFRALANSLAEAGLLRLGILEVDSVPAAMVMCFDYNDCIYLYNSGYDGQYDPLSVGLLSKVLYIKESIQKGKKKFDFLRGNETYKHHLGGREIPLHSCRITIK
ncbi:MAG: GNAT family N-acetyltransferase [Dehalococcoidales bacterium]|nr:GNAT family N-acetyltransferase [Dehalococcoidales bacterium]